MTIDDEQTIQQTEQTLLAYIRRQRLLQSGDRVLAACSGGADSMALLLFLLRCRHTLGITVAAVHVNHGIRGAAADADAAFVEEFCRRQGVECLLYDAARQGVAVPRHASEDWARRLRYGWFDTLAREQNAKIATAHTMTDQAETMLLRLARGTGLHGLAGILPRRGPYIRPFLCLERAQTEAYCAALGQSYVQDATNDAPVYARNRIRAQALPVLQSINPGAVRAMGRLAEQLADADALLRREASDLLVAAAAPGGYRRQPLRDAPGALRDAALCLLLEGQGLAPEARIVSLLRDLVDTGHGAVQAAPGLRFLMAEDLLRCEKASPAAAAAPTPAPPQPLRPGTYHLPGGYVLEIRVLPFEKYEKFIKNAGNSKKGLTSCADYDKINRNVFLRTRRPGDYFRPSGRGGGKTLKKWFNALRIPVERRPCVPLLARGSEVLWMWGSGFAEGSAPDADTRTVLVLHPLEGPVGDWRVWADRWEDDHGDNAE